jgi:type II secretory pathway pseudopilin PulG
MAYRTKSAGFSLVEITMVILAVSVMMVGTLYGLRVVHNARIKSFIVQINLYQTAANNFRKQYGTWPGDLANAQNVIPGCTAARQCVGGNGDQIVASRNNSYDCQMPSFSHNQQNFPCKPAAKKETDLSTVPSESIQFWRHLALSGMISDLRMRPSRFDFGDSMPKSRLVGGFHLIYEGNINSRYLRGLKGHFFFLSRDADILHANMHAYGNAVMSPQTAGVIDKQMDDGFPNTGLLRSIGGSGDGCGDVENAHNEYANNDGQTTDARQCTIFYKFDS